MYLIVGNVSDNTLSATLSIHPQPAVARCRIDAAFQYVTPLAVRLFDAQGREVRTIASRGRSYQHSIDLDLRELPSGVYLLEAQTSRETIRRTILHHHH
jgi:hypothetical protein